MSTPASVVIYYQRISAGKSLYDAVSQSIDNVFAVCKAPMYRPYLTGEVIKDLKKRRAVNEIIRMSVFEIIEMRVNQGRLNKVLRNGRAYISPNGTTEQTSR